MTYEQIEKDANDFLINWKGEILGDGKQEFKSFLKQSFIKYLQEELDRTEMIFQSIIGDSEYDRGKDDILLDQIKHLEAQIKELQ